VVPSGSFFLLPEQSLEKENVLEPGEILTAILLDPPQPGTRSTYRKVRERGAFDFALAGAAIALTLTQGKVRTARVVLSGVAPVPWRSVEAEKALTGQSLEASVATVAAEAAVRNAFPLTENGYKVPLVRGILEETLAALAA
jgi:xanthine dehydrogenase YagS FAD-binding subunit